MSDPNAYYADGLGVAMYDLFTDGGLLEGDVDFYVEQTRRFGGPILELAVGTGRILLPLAAAGHEVVGLDRSPAMLAMAKARFAARPELQAQLVEGDMRRFDLNRSFALIIIAARSFQHLVEPADQRAALSCVRRHLQPGGHLILDLFDPNFELLFDPSPPAVPSREARNPETGRMVRRSIAGRETDKLRQTITETLRFEEIDASGNVTMVEETSWTLRWSLRQEMLYLFELCGFAPVAQFSDFKGSPPAYGREQLWIARAV
jgi:SAM-dependent methyltransferase